MKKKFVLFTLVVCTTVFSFAQDAADKINQGNEALQAGEYAKAFQLYDEAMSNLGDVEVDASINYNIGFAAYKAENMDGAVKYFDKAIEAGVNVAKSYEYKALAYNDKKDYAKAVEFFEKAVEAADETDASLIYNAGIAAYRGSMLDKAVELFGKAADLGYNAETAIYYKAVALNKLGKDAEYEETLKQGAEKFPDDEKITSALAKIYVSEANGLYKKGAGILSAANQKINDGSLKTTDDAYKAEVTKAQKEFSSAVEILEKAKQLDSSNANIQTLLDACNAVL